MFTRRQLGFYGAALAACGALPRSASAAAPGAAQAGGAPGTRTLIQGVNLGTHSYTFARAPIDEVISGVRDAGFGICEIHPFNLEPVFSGLTNEGPNRIARPRDLPLSPAEQAIVKHSREQQRAWRLSVPMEYFQDIARRFREVGVLLPTYSYHYFNLSDEEMDRSFEMAKALGATVMTAVTPAATVPKLDAMAKAHGVRLAIHNSFGMNTVAQLEEVVRGLSTNTGYCLDIGHFAAAGSNPIEMLTKHRDRIYAMHIKDRKLNGPPQPLGEGDTPVVEVLRWLRDNRFSVPAHLEQEIEGWDRLAIAKRDLEYCRRALTT